MATEKQIAANSRNAARSTGPRSTSGKARSSRNALRHGLAASKDGQGPVSEASLDLEVLCKRLESIETERTKLIFEIETQLWKGDGNDIAGLVRQLDALERYAKRSASALRKKEKAPLPSI